ncbi:CD151 antigen-like [Rhipicephalus microplus]|uniref:CD151 antigen-like n=1 Tax=Rhipicephalus microplus TaxID=6941 RepID=UPI003F6AF070
MRIPSKNPINWQDWKYSFLKVNRTVQLSGLALAGLGTFLLMDEQRLTLLPLLRAQQVQYLTIALVGSGGLVLLVGFFGCCGTVKKSRCLLGTYLAFVFLVLACEIATGTLALIFQHKIILDMKDNLNESLKTEYGKKTHVTTAFDWAQAKMLCCGVSGPADYAESVWKVEGIGRGDNVSKTCCRLRDEPDAHKNPQPLNETLCQNGDDRHSKHDLKMFDVFFLGIGEHSYIIQVGKREV